MIGINMRSKNIKNSARLIAAILIQVLLFSNSVLAGNAYIAISGNIDKAHLSPKVAFSGNYFKDNFQLLADSLKTNGFALPQFDENDYQEAFAGIYFDRFSDLDAAKLKIAAILHSGQTPQNVDPALVEEAEIILDEAANLFGSIFPEQGIVTYNPQTLYDNPNITVHNLHLIFEAGKLFSQQQIHRRKLDQLFQEFTLFILPVEAKGKYQVSLLNDLRLILLSGGKIKESRMSVGGKGVYFFQMGGNQEVDAQTKFNEFFPFTRTSIEEFTAQDYPLKVLRDKIGRFEGKDEKNLFPMVIRITADLPSKQAIGYPFNDTFKKSGRLIEQELDADQYEILISLNSLYLESNNDMKSHLIAKNILQENNGVLKLVDQSKAILDNNGRESGWMGLTFNELKYEIVDLKYTNKDKEMESLSSDLTKEISSVLRQKSGASNVLSTGSSARGVAVDKPDFDFRVIVPRGENIDDITNWLKDENIIEDLLTGFKARLAKIYDSETLEIKFEGKKTVGRISNLSLLKFSFLINGRVVGGVDLNFLNEGSLDDSLIYSERYAAQLDDILSNLDESQREPMRRYLAGQIKALKGFIQDVGLYKDKDKERDFFQGIAVEQLIYDLPSFFDIPQDLSFREMQQVFSWRSVMYLLSQLDITLYDGANFTTHKKIDQNWFALENKQFNLQDGKGSLMKTVGNAINILAEFANKEQSQKTNKIKITRNELLKNRVNKIRILNFISGFRDEVKAAVALGRTKAFSKLSFVYRLELVRQIFSGYGTEMDVFAMSTVHISNETKLEVARLIVDMKNKIAENNETDSAEINAKQLKTWFGKKTPNNSELFERFYEYGRNTSDRISVNGFIRYLLQSMEEQRNLAQSREMRNRTLKGRLMEAEQTDSLLGQSI